jgi:hypothetical protein
MEKNAVMQAARNKADTTTTKIIKGQRRGLNAAFSSVGFVEEERVGERRALSRLLVISPPSGSIMNPRCGETVKLLWRRRSPPILKR